jgi:ribonucleoside-diphosphate reductase alpha chain
MSVNTSELSVGVDTFPTTHFQDAFSKEVWESTYKDHNDTTIDDTMRRIAKAVASVEDTEFQQELWEERFYDMLTDFKVTAGGRIYANAGTEWGGTTMLNCFVAPRANYDIDSLPAIIDDVFKQAQTLKSEGGWGQNFSWIRPRGAFIGGIGVESPGSVKYMEIYDKVSDVITSGSGTKSKNKKAKGKIRKGAMMGILDVWHPDIIEFITAKQQPGRLTKFNISVNCTDAFMSKVINVIEWKKDLDNLKTLYSNNVTEDQQKEIVILESDIETEDVWSLRFPDTTHVGYKDNWDGDIATWESMGYPVTEFRKVSASWLWNLMMESTYNRAEPGIVFLDRANYFDPLSYYHKIIATNPCGEQVLPPAGVCNLGSVNLTQFVLADGSGFDLEQIEKYVVYTVRFLDNVNSLSNAPLPEYVDSMQNKRRIGVGILGWGSALFMLKVRFGSEQAS